ncbi:MAG: hypothetical protein F6K03_07665 [Kamptonema sp. SIO4C4]|nr:hypothetical protein [Kamptonema sp. SIO4C4]
MSKSDEWAVNGDPLMGTLCDRANKNFAGAIAISTNTLAVSVTFPNESVG